jgi:large subunit ribosomal protein L24
MPRSKRLKVGDLVQVISGKDKGKQGKITKLLIGRRQGRGRGREHGDPQPEAHARNQQGGQIKKDAPIHARR